MYYVKLSQTIVQLFIEQESWKVYLVSFKTTCNEILTSLTTCVLV